MSRTSIDAEEDTLVGLDVRFRQAPAVAVVLDAVKNEGSRSHANPAGIEELVRFDFVLALATPFQWQQRERQRGACLWRVALCWLQPVLLLVCVPGSLAGSRGRPGGLRASVSLPRGPRGFGCPRGACLCRLRRFRRVAACSLGHLPQVVFTWRVFPEFFCCTSQFQIQETAKVSC